MTAFFEIVLLSLTIFFEAGGECYDNKVAHACVIRNRVESEMFADNYYDVIFQRDQFSCYRMSELVLHLSRLYSLNVLERKSMAECFRIGYGIYYGYIADNTNCSLWYSLKYIRKKSRKVRLFRVWMKHLNINAEYGCHNNPTVFYGS